MFFQWFWGRKVNNYISVGLGIAVSLGMLVYHLMKILKFEFKIDKKNKDIQRILQKRFKLGVGVKIVIFCENLRIENNSSQPSKKVINFLVNYL